MQSEPYACSPRVLRPSPSLSTKSHIILGFDERRSTYDTVERRVHTIQNEKAGGRMLPTRPLLFAFTGTTTNQIERKYLFYLKVNRSSQPIDQSRSSDIRRRCLPRGASGAHNGIVHMILAYTIALWLWPWQWHCDSYACISQVSETAFYAASIR